MASVFTQGERGWADPASTSLHHSVKASSSSLLHARPPHRLSYDFSAAAAGATGTTDASPSSPSLDEIRARLQDVMRSIDDTLIDAEASPPALHPVPTAQPFDTLHKPTCGEPAERKSRWGGDWTTLPQRPLAHPQPSVTAPSSSSSRCSSSASASWPSPRRTPASAPTFTTAPPSYHHFADVRATTHGATVAVEEEDSAATCSTTEMGLSATFKATLDFWRASGHRGLRRASVEDKVGGVSRRSAAAAGVPASKFATAPAPCVASALSSQTTASKYTKPTSRAGVLSTGAACGMRPSTTNTETLTSTSVTTGRPSRSPSAASSSSFPDADRRRPPLPPRSAVVTTPRTSWSTFESCAEEAVPSSSSAPAAVAAASKRSSTTQDRTASPATVSGDTLRFNRNAASLPSGVPSLLPHPDTVPSLSARLAALRATDALQRTALQQRDASAFASYHDEHVVAGPQARSLSLSLLQAGNNVEEHKAGDLRDAAGVSAHPAEREELRERPSVEHHGGVHPAASSRRRGAGDIDTPVTHRQFSHTRELHPFFSSPPPPPPFLRSVKAEADRGIVDGTRFIDGGARDGHTNDCGIIRIHHNDDDVLVRSPDVSYSNSPRSAERRNRRDARLWETSRIVALALERQAAAEEAWREGQPPLRRAPPRPRSASPSASLVTKQSNGVVNSTWRGGRGGEGGGREMDGGGDRQHSLSTAPLDALQDRLMPYSTSSAVVAAGSAGEGELPMQEELAVRERIAARRGGNGSCEGGVTPRVQDSPAKAVAARQLLLRQQRQDHRSYARLSEARDEDISDHLHREVARQTNVQVDALARVARVQANAPATDADVSKHVEELQAIRAHAEQLAKLRRRMQQEGSPSSATAVTPATSYPVSVRGNTANRVPEAAALPDATASTSPSLNILEAGLSSVQQHLRVDSPRHAREVADTSYRTASAHSAVVAGREATAEPKGVVTTVSTAAALKATSVTVDSADDDADDKTSVDGDTPLSTVSATSVDEREPTPERVASPVPRRVASGGVVSKFGVKTPTSPQLMQGTESRQQRGQQQEQSGAGEKGRPQSHPQRPPAHARVATTTDGETKHYANYVASTDCASDTATSDSSQHDEASSTQLPPPKMQVPPPRPAPTPPSVFTEQSSVTLPASQTSSPAPSTAQPPRRKDVSTATDAMAEAEVHPTVPVAEGTKPRTSNPNSVGSLRADEPPSPLPTKPSTSDVPRRCAADRSNEHRHHLGGLRGGGNRTGPSVRTAKEPKSLRARVSSPVEDAEHDIISSSPSAGRQHHLDIIHNTSISSSVGGGGGSLTPERLASIQSTRLHVSPTRGTAWQDGFASAHSVSHSARQSSLSSSTSSVSSDFMVPPDFARKGGTRTLWSGQHLNTLPQASRTATLRSSTPPFSSSTCGPSSLSQVLQTPLVPPSVAATVAVPAAASAPLPSPPSPVDPLLTHRRVVQRAASRRTVLRAQTMLVEYGVSVEVQLAGRRLPAVVKLSKNKKELLFYLERFVEAAEARSQPSTPGTRSLVTSAASSVVGATSVMSESPLAQQARRSPTLPQSAQQQQHRPGQLSPFRQRGSLYSVASSVSQHATAADRRTATPPATAPVKTKIMAGPPPPGFVKLPAGAAAAGYGVIPSPVLRLASAGAPQQPQRPFAVSPPARFGTPSPPPPSITHPASILQPHADRLSHSRAGSSSYDAGDDSHAPRTPSRALVRRPPSTVRVRELHHFPCSYARVYVPYGVLGYEGDCGVGGPDTWEDVCGVLCGPAAYEVLRRYGCPLFASMRGRDYVPYRVYVIIPEFQRIDVPQDAVLLVLDFKQRVDWVIFLMAMQLSVVGGGSGERSADATPKRADEAVSASATGDAQPSVLSYGRALWMLAVQRVQRARALRGSNPFEAHLAARQRDGERQETPSRAYRRGVLLLREGEGGMTGGTSGPAQMNAASTAVSPAATSPTPSPQQEPLTTAVATVVSGRTSSLRFAAPPFAAAAPASLLRSPRRGLVVERRSLQQAGSPGPSPLRRGAAVTSSGATSAVRTAVARPCSSRNNGSHSGGLFPTAVRLDGKGGRASTGVAPARATSQVTQREKAEELLHAKTVHVDAPADDVAPPPPPPLSSEETSKPRFRWLKRVAGTLNSSRRRSAVGKQVPHIEEGIQ
jgi:hypothetical protein